MGTEELADHFTITVFFIRPQATEIIGLIENLEAKGEEANFKEESLEQETMTLIKVRQRILRTLAA